MEKIDNYLKILGFDESRGTSIIREALNYIINENTDVFSLKSVIKYVSEKMNIKEANVERQMRLKIENVFLHGNIEILHKEFKFLNESTGRPTNKEFLALVCEKLRNT